MNRILPALLVAVSVATVAAQPSGDRILFRNGDFLYGQLLAIDARDAVRWRQPDATKPIDFVPGNVAQIDFPNPPATAETPRSSLMCRVILANGDTLEGELVSCDRESISLQTAFGGRLNIARASLQTLVFFSQSEAIFNGITGLDGWTQGSAAAAFLGESGKWTYRNGAFYAAKPASIARDVHLPDIADIQFDVAWKNSLNLAVALYTDSLQPILLTAKDQGPNFGGFYSLRFFNSAFIDLWPIRKSDHLQRQIEHSQVFYPSLTTKERVHVDLRVSKPAHKIALYLDDIPVKEWDDPEGFVGEGTGLRFVQNSGTGIKLSNLRVTPWDGVFSEATPETPDSKLDIVWPQHGQKLSGTIQSAGGGRMTIRTSRGPEDILFSEIKAVDFARVPNSPASVLTGPVRATFANGGSVTFVLESWRPNEMIVRSADFGKARLNPAAFTRLQFLGPDKKPAGPNG